jgi:hypothetical protein
MQLSSIFFLFGFLRLFTSTLSSSCTSPSSVHSPPVIVLFILSPTSFLHLSDNLPHSPLLPSAPVLVFFSLSNHTFLLLFILLSPFSSFPLSHFFHFLNLLLALFFFLLRPVSLRRFRIIALFRTQNLSVFHNLYDLLLTYFLTYLLN